MRIAILGWGSLLWEKHPEFDSHHDEWRLDGPVLPVEFSRVSGSRDGALTLVIDREHGTPTTVGWCLSKRTDLGDAIRDLRLREETSARNIDRMTLSDHSTEVEAPHTTIRDWAGQKDFDAVIWTGLSSNFSEETKQQFSVKAAISYLQDLDGVDKARAVEYIERAPAFVETPLRAAFRAAQIKKSVPRRDTSAARDVLLDYAATKKIVSLRFESLIKAIRDIAALGCAMILRHAKDRVLVAPGNDDRFYTEVYFLGAVRHTILLIESLATLLENGLTHPARIISRTLYELLVTAKYIDKESTTALARQLLYSSLLDQETSWVETIRMLENVGGRDDSIKDLKEQLERIRGDLGKVSSPAVTNRKITNWSGNNLRDMSRSVGLESEYLAAYKDLSWDAHGTLAAFHITHRTADGELVMRDMFDLKDTRHVAALAGNWALGILELVAKRWQLTEAPVARLQSRFSVETRSVVWPGSSLNEPRLPSRGVFVMGLDVGFSSSRETCCAYLLHIDPLTNTIDLAAAAKRFSFPEAKKGLLELLGTARQPKIVAIDAPLTPSRHQTCPPSGRCVDKWFSQGLFSAAKRGPQTTSIAVPKQGWPLYCAGMDLVQVLREVVPELEYIRFEDLNNPKVRGIVECIPKLFQALLVDAAIVQQRTVQLDDHLFPQLFAGDLRPRFDRLLGSFKLSQELDAEVVRLATNPPKFHEEIGGIVAALQAAIFLTGRASVVGCSGDTEGYFVLPAVAFWNDEWFEAFRRVAKKDESVRIIATLWDQPEIVEQPDS